MATKPSRSDELLAADEQETITNQVKAHFDSLAPIRPTKPHRSEPDPDVETAADPGVDRHHHRVPELHKFKSLQKSEYPVKISIDGNNNTAPDEFLETGYYKELESVGTQHHTTGNGFIRISRGEDEDEDEDEDEYRIRLETRQGAGDDDHGCDRSNFKSNPATNDWIPSVEENQVFLSLKPNRSEG